MHSHQEQVPAAADGRPTARAPANGARVLVVDDEYANRRLLQTILKHQGYVVEVAEHGPAALAHIREHGCDLVLLDVMMPGLDGIEVCRAIRDQLELPLLPVILVTALADAQSRTRGKRAGADDFITKPVYEDELLARVGSLLRARAIHEALDRERAELARQTRRWRLVSRVAELVGRAKDLDDIAGNLMAALADDLRIARPRFVFDREGAGVDAAGIRLPLSRVDGAVHVSSAAGCALTADERELLMALLPHIDNAVAAARLAQTRAALDRARERLAAHLVHDLKNPLAIIAMNLEAARDAARDGGGVSAVESVTSPLEDAATANRRLQRMVLDLLDIHRAEDGKLPFHPAATHVGALLKETAEGFRLLIQSAGARLSIDVGADVTPVSVDAALLRRVVENLLVNAARFVPADGVVEACVWRAATTLHIAIANDGPSLAVDERRAIFEKFGQTRPDQTTMNRGLGLYFCRLVAERHGGTISAADREPRGVCFRISLPIAPDEPR